MSAGSQAAAPTLTTALFGGVPAETNTASQGSIYLYQSSNCSSALSDTATPLLLGECLNMPVNGITAVSIKSLSVCSDDGTPLLLVSDQPDCKSSTEGSSADSGETMKCLIFEEVDVDMGSVVFSCFGNWISSVAPSSAASTSAPVQTSDSGGSGDSGDSSGPSISGGCDSCESCCCIFGIVVTIIAVVVAGGACMGSKLNILPG
jgi:hypothetical protein